MEIINTEFKILQVSEPVSLTFVQFDFIIDDFDHTCSKWMVEYTIEYIYILKWFIIPSKR
jgi:hypothetical protein